MEDERTWTYHLFKISILKALTILRENTVSPRVAALGEYQWPRLI